jgi:hypothetical protein
MRIKKAAFGTSFAIAVAAPAVAHATPCSDGSSSSPPPHHDLDHRITPPEERDECMEREIFLMPGVMSTYFQPNAGLGAFYGGGFQFAPVQWSHNNDKFGPSQVSLITQAAFLTSQKAPSVMSIFEGGATASLERNSSRRWMIPYFGAMFGAINQQQLGTSGYAYPLLGVHFYYHHNLMIDGEGGYHFPFQDIDQMRGPRAQLAARFSLW